MSNKLKMNVEGMDFLIANGTVDYSVAPGADHYTQTRVMEWQPGDGTRYQMRFSKIPSVDFVAEGWLVTDLNITRGTMIATGRGVYSTGYVLQSLGARTRVTPRLVRAQAIIINALVGDLGHAESLMTAFRKEYLA